MFPNWGNSPKAKRQDIVDDVVANFNCQLSFSLFITDENLLLKVSTSRPLSIPYFYFRAMRSLVFNGKPCATFITPPSIASSSLRLCSVLTKTHCRLHQISTKSTNLRTSPSTRFIPIASVYKMSQKPFSNTDVPGDKPADPYKATNLTEPDLKEKVQDLAKFMDSCKFGMMTTRIESSGLLTSRCMALAAKVGFHVHTCYTQ